MSVLREDEWGRKQIAERLERFADRNRFPVEEAVSLKLRPVVNGNQGYEESRELAEGPGVVQDQSSGRQWPIEVAWHETGLEILTAVGVVIGIIGTLVTIAVTISDRMGARRPKDQTSVLIQQRMRRRDGAVEERTVIVVNPPPPLLEQVAKLVPTTEQSGVQRPKRKVLVRKVPAQKPPGTKPRNKKR